MARKPMKKRKISDEQVPEAIGNEAIHLVDVVGAAAVADPSKSHSDNFVMEIENQHGKKVMIVMTATAFLRDSIGWPAHDEDPEYHQ